MGDFPFIGRKDELKSLRDLTSKKTSSLVALRGRRRIGKSRLIEEFARLYKGCRFLPFSGIAPTELTTSYEQKEEFAKQLSTNLDLPPLRVDDWSDLFSYLAKATRNGKIVILFDEISWMGSKDQMFLGKLKNAWDMEFKKNPRLIMVLCGSVSSWIEKNILGSTGFMGRFSLVLDLKGLSISESAEFLDKTGFCDSVYERCKVLAVTGGIPRYLEEIKPDKLADENIKDLCFKSSGILFREFNDIFSDIFGRRSETYEKITRSLVSGRKELAEIAKSIGMKKGGHLSNYMTDLIMSGFIKRDYVWSIKQKSHPKLSYYRLSDNYLRFYLKYIEPNSSQIKSGHFNNKALSTLPAFDSIMALQFENLVLKNGGLIIKKLNAGFEDVVKDGSYFQRPQPSAAIKGCQIDYMIQLKTNMLFACEIKFSLNEIGIEVVSKMQEKLKNLVKPRGFAIVPILIHVNGVNDSVINSNYFHNIIDFGEMMKAD